MTESIDECPRTPPPMGCCGSCDSIGEGGTACYCGEELRVYNYNLHFSNYSALDFFDYSDRLDDILNSSLPVLLKDDITFFIV